MTISIKIWFVLNKTFSYNADLCKSINDITFLFCYSWIHITIGNTSKNQNKHMEFMHWNTSDAVQQSLQIG